jgi:hypothetical protein
MLLSPRTAAHDTAACRLPQKTADRIIFLASSTVATQVWLTNTMVNPRVVRLTFWSVRGVDGPSGLLSPFCGVYSLHTSWTNRNTDVARMANQRTFPMRVRSPLLVVRSQHEDVRG